MSKQRIEINRLLNRVLSVHGDRLLPGIKKFTQTGDCEYDSIGDDQTKLIYSVRSGDYVTLQFHQFTPERLSFMFDLHFKPPHRRLFTAMTDLIQRKITPHLPFFYHFNPEYTIVDSSWFSSPLLDWLDTIPPTEQINGFLFQYIYTVAVMERNRFLLGNPMLDLNRIRSIDLSLDPDGCFEYRLLETDLPPISFYVPHGGRMWMMTDYDSLQRQPPAPEYTETLLENHFDLKLLKKFALRVAYHRLLRFQTTPELIAKLKKLYPEYQLPDVKPEDLKDLLLLEVSHLEQSLLPPEVTKMLDALDIAAGPVPALRRLKQFTKPRGKVEGVFTLIL